MAIMVLVVGLVTKANVLLQIYKHRLSGKPYTAQQRRQKKRYVPHFLTRLSKHKLPTSVTLHNISFTHCVGFLENVLIDPIITNHEPKVQRI